MQMAHKVQETTEAFRAWKLHQNVVCGWRNPPRKENYWEKEATT